MRFSVVLFDLDGTLIDTNHLIVTSFRHTLKEKLGLDVSAEAIYKHFGEPLPTTMARYNPDRALELTDFYRVFNLANHDALVRGFEGIREMLAALRAAGVKLGVVTSKRRDLALRGMQVCGLEDCFDTVVGMDETEKHKPDPEPVFLALERLGESPGSHVLMVGDSRFDVECGRNAGVLTAAVGWTVQERGGLTPELWVESAADLTALVLGT